MKEITVHTLDIFCVSEILFWQTYGAQAALQTERPCLYCSRCKSAVTRDYARLLCAEEALENWTPTLIKELQALPQQAAGKHIMTKKAPAKRKEWGLQISTKLGQQPLPTATLTPATADHGGMQQEFAAPADHSNALEAAATIRLAPANSAVETTSSAVACNGLAMAANPERESPLPAILPSIPDTHHLAEDTGEEELSKREVDGGTEPKASASSPARRSEQLLPPNEKEPLGKLQPNGHIHSDGGVQSEKYPERPEAQLVMTSFKNAGTPWDGALQIHPAAANGNKARGNERVMNETSLRVSDGRAAQPIIAADVPKLEMMKPMKLGLLKPTGKTAIKIPKDWLTKMQKN